MSEAVRIRPFRPGDEPALMEVCRRTADAGGDSSYLFSERDLVGTIWCMPYLVLEPDLASVVASGDEPPVGYVLGALDVDVTEGVARVRGGGSIAGSTLTQDAALRRAVAFGAPLADAVSALTSVPARAVGRPDLGSLRQGAAADAVLLDADLRVRAVWAGGSRV